MKKYSSVWALTVRTVLFPILALLAVCAAAQIGFFARAMQADPIPLSFGSTEAAPWQGRLAMDALLTQSRTALFAGFALLGMIALCCSWCSKENTLYTLSRLRISYRRVMLCQVCANTMFFLLFWGAQICVLLAQSALYLSRDCANPQGFFLACWQSGFAHRILPLDDTVGWLTDLLLTAALGISVTTFAHRRRKGRFSWGFTVLAVGLGVFAQADFTGAASPLLFILSGFVLLADGLILFGKEEDSDEASAEAS